MTQPGAALKGVRTRRVDDRLHEIALRAMVDHPDSQTAAEDAIWETVRRDGVLMDALLSPYRHQAIDHLLFRVRRDLGYNPATGTNPTTMHIPSEAHVLSANSPLRRRARMVSTTWDREHKARLHKEQDAEIQRLNEYREWRNAWRSTSAAHVEVNGKPFWTVCVNEARDWIARTGHATRFMELVISGVPDDGHPIEAYRRPDEINALWEQAGAA